MGGGDFIEINCPMFFTFYEAVKGKIKGQNRLSWISTVFCRQLK